MNPLKQSLLLKILVVLSIPGFASGCTPNRFLYYHPQVTKTEPVSLVEQAKQIEKQNFDNIKLVTIAKNKLSTHHLVIVKKEEPLHTHATHDLWALCLRGKGELVLGDKRFQIHPGSSVYIPRGVPHKAINRGKEPIAALVIFTPPYDGKDTVPVSKDLSRLK